MATSPPPYHSCIYRPTPAQSLGFCSEGFTFARFCNWANWTRKIPKKREEQKDLRDESDIVDRTTDEQNYRGR